MRRMPRTVSASIACFVAGCSFLVDTSDRVQCSVTADCEASPALAGRVCRAGFCERDPQPVSGDAGEQCTSTAVCTQKNSGRASVCKTAGQPCVVWQTEGCPSITGNWDDPNAIVIGSLLPLNIRLRTGAVESPYSKRVLRAIDLAVEEVAAGVPASFFVGGKSRPLAVLHCDTQGDPATARAMFTHLTDVVGAPGVIVAWDEDMAAVAALAGEKRTAVVCSDCFTPLPPDPRVWRILPPLSGDAALIASRVLELEQQIKAQSAGDIRVAVLVDGANAQKRFLDDLVNVLVFNGMGVAPNGPTRWLAVQTEDPRKEFIDYDRYDKLITDFAPHVVIAGMASDFPTYHLPGIEKGVAATGAPRPFYVLTQISYDAQPFSTALGDDALRARVSGTHPYTTEERRAIRTAYEERYRTSFKEAANGNFSGYEAFYAMAYAIAARAGQPLLDGAQINAGFPSLVGGTTYPIGPAALPEAVPALRLGPIDLRGIYTELDWNLSTGAIASDMGMFCFRKQADGSIALHDVDAMRWSFATKQTTGVFSCPP